MDALVVPSDFLLRLADMEDLVGRLEHLADQAGSSNVTDRCGSVTIHSMVA